METCPVGVLRARGATLPPPFRRRARYARHDVIRSYAAGCLRMNGMTSHEGRAGDRLARARPAAK